MNQAETMGVLQEELKRYRRLLSVSRQQREVLEGRPSAKALEKMMMRKQSIIDQIGALEAEMGSKPAVRLTREQSMQAEAAVAEIREMVREMIRLEEESRRLLSAQTEQVAGELRRSRSKRKLSQAYAKSTGPSRFLDQET